MSNTFSIENEQTGMINSVNESKKQNKNYCYRTANTVIKAATTVKLVMLMSPVRL